MKEYAARVTYSERQSASEFPYTGKHHASTGDPDVEDEAKSSASDERFSGPSEPLLPPSS